MEPNVKRVYNTVLSQTISTDGNYLFVGNTFGNIFVFRLVSFRFVYLISLLNHIHSIQSKSKFFLFIF